LCLRRELRLALDFLRGYLPNSEKVTRDGDYFYIFEEEIEFHS